MVVRDGGVRAEDVLSLGVLGLEADVLADGQAQPEGERIEGLHIV